jgi:hypothetical protein
MSLETSPHSSPTSSRPRTPMSIDLSSVPLVQPTSPSNTLLITNLQDPEIFRPENLQTIKDFINSSQPIHTWTPLKSFKRIIVSFFDEAASISIRQVLDGELVMEHRIRVYFGQPTSIEEKDEHLPLPKAGKLFFISPPPSPPQGWEMKLEGAPNKQVHAEDLADALSKLRHGPGTDFPDSPASDGMADRCRKRSGSVTTIYHPDDHGACPLLPAIAVQDLTIDFEQTSSVNADTKAILANTTRPPLELLDG